MMNKYLCPSRFLFLSITTMLSGITLEAQETEYDDLIEFKEIGQLKTRHAKDIESSTWSIGGETLDRDFADYHAYKKYLGPLGAKKIRLQGGWFKCEPEKGSYNFKWMDDVVNDAHSQGVMPWIELAYGNPIYNGGGEAKLGGALPTSEEALQAWDKWVEEMVTRYMDKVTEWEVWNEPDHGKDITGKSYAYFFIRTAKLIKGIQPNAKILGLPLSSLNSIDFLKEFYETLKVEGEISLLDVIVYHGYSAAYGWAYNPDDLYPQFEVFKKAATSFNPSVKFMQGESGAPSTPNPKSGVFKDYRWNELLQAKWDLRRMLGDFGRGIGTSLFAMSDMHYNWGHPIKEIQLNTKGILKTNQDKTIDRPKLMYGVAQRVFSLFDSRIVADSTITIETDRINQSAFGHTYNKNEMTLITIWQNEYPPYESYGKRSTTITVTNGSFSEPVLVDLISGKIYEIPLKLWSKQKGKYTFEDVPVTDYPLILTDKTVVVQ